MEEKNMTKQSALRLGILVADFFLPDNENTADLIFTNR
jgi:hypothetical protein